ncbi:hypothetical protein D3C76_1559880 [compost metagenome]
MARPASPEPLALRTSTEDEASFCAMATLIGAPLTLPVKAPPATSNLPAMASFNPVTLAAGMSGIRARAKMPEAMAEASKTSLFATRSQVAPLETIQSPRTQSSTPSISVLPAAVTR